MCGGKAPDPVVVEPKKDQENLETKAAQEGVKRRRRFSTLMETGGAGDTSAAPVAAPAAAAKQTLGQ